MEITTKIRFTEKIHEVYILMIYMQKIFIKNEYTSAIIN